MLRLLGMNTLFLPDLQYHFMKKSTKVRLASFSAAFLLVLGGLLLDTRLLLNSSKTELEYTTGGP